MLCRILLHSQIKLNRVFQYKSQAQNQNLNYGLVAQHCTAKECGEVLFRKHHANYNEFMINYENKICVLRKLKTFH